MAIEASIDIEETMGDIGKNRSKIASFREVLQQKVDEAVKETAEEFRDAVIANIEGSRIEEDTGELLSSWEIQPKGVAKYEVHSTADHAVFLEVGTDAHDISGNPLLFQPEPEKYGEYPDAVKRSNGYVELETVEHPGNDAYRYFEAAMRSRDWVEVLDNKIDDAITEAKNKVGL